MRFAIPIPPRRSLIFSGRLSDWPLSLRLAAFVLPAGMCLALIAVWLGYNAATTSLEESLEAVPLIEAKAQAERMGNILTHLRHSLVRIAQSGRINAQDVQRQAGLYFQDSTPLVYEIGLKEKNGNSFLLLRDEEGFREINLGDASQGAYSPFQQLNIQSLTAGKGALFPVVFAHHASREGKESTQRTPVLRMALPLADSGGTLILGIDLRALQKRLAVYARSDSPLRSPLQEGALQLSYFFDSGGWILFEMGSGPEVNLFPDLARRGYTGDLGRPGYDVAFRPLGTHEDYWRMVVEVQQNKSGSAPTSAAHYSSVYAQSRAFLCFAPVHFYPTDDAAPQLVGGIAFFETSSLPLAAFLRVANASVIISLITLCAFTVLIVIVGRILGRPLRGFARQFKAMNESGELHALEGAPACAEHQNLQAAANTFISRAMVMQTDMERVKREVQYTRSRSPADLTQALSKPLLPAEFGLVGSSPLMQEVREQVHKAARAGTDVLIWGETGTGKELVAEAIHKASSRKNGPFISINCGALDENLLLDVLFGHVKGAFTEARTDRKGAFLAADGGTLHLDEVGNASAKVQQSLLRALSVRRIRPLGTDAELPFNTRVVAATNVDLRECVRDGSFREDLYYRLAIISIETPPLRHRKEDLPELAAHCIHEAAASMGRPEVRLSRGALDIMAAHDWPGNVREFKNCITRAMAFVEGDLILPQHITLEVDAFRTYAQPRVPRTQQRDTGGDAAAPQQGRTGAPEQGRSETPRRRAGEESHAAEYLWPAPPREAFTPALSERDKNGEEAGRQQETYLPGPGWHTPAPVLPVPSFVDSASWGAAHSAFPAAERQPSDGFARQQEGLAAPGRQPDAQADDARVVEQAFAWLPATVIEKLNERQVRALRYIRRTGGLTRTEYEAVVGQEVSARTAQNDLRDLVTLGILERVGAGPGTHYTLRQQAE